MKTRECGSNSILIFSHSAFRCPGPERAELPIIWAAIRGAGHFSGLCSRLSNRFQHGAAHEANANAFFTRNSLSLGVGLAMKALNYAVILAMVLGAMGASCKRSDVPLPTAPGPPDEIKTDRHSSVEHVPVFAWQFSLPTQKAPNLRDF